MVFLKKCPFNILYKMYTTEINIHKVKLSKKKNLSSKSCWNPSIFSRNNLQFRWISKITIIAINMIQVNDCIVRVDLISGNCILGYYIIKLKKKSQSYFLSLSEVINQKNKFYRVFILRTRN